MAGRAKLTRNFNFTERERIKSKYVTVSASQEGITDEGLRVDFRFNLAKYRGKLPAEAVVIAEAYRSVAYARKRLGLLCELEDNVSIPVTFERFFLRPEESRFRLKIVAPSHASPESQGLLMAVAENLRLRATRQRSSKKDLLPTQTIDDLGEVPWKCDFDDNRGVTLFLNGRLFDSSKKIKDAEGWILPAALRDILTYILLDSDGDSGWDKWQSEWIEHVTQSFAGGMSPPSPKEGKEEIIDWIERAVEGLCKRGRFVTKLKR
ncbi:MAG: hypothetical protein ACP5UB_04840 [Candidatus Sumerlaeaceae bacterium]